MRIVTHRSQAGSLAGHTVICSDEELADIEAALAHTDSETDSRSRSAVLYSIQRARRSGECGEDGG